MFELIYRQHIPRAPPYLGMSLSVRGTKVPYSAFFRSRIRSGNKIKKMRNSSEECSSPELSKQRKKKFTELKVTNFSGSEISEFEDSAKELLSDHSYVVRNAEILEENVDDKDRVISGIAKLKNLNYRQSKMKLTGLDELLFFDIGSEPILETENKPKNITESSSSDMFYDAEPESFQKIKPTLHIIKPPYTSFRNKSDKYKDDNDIKIGTSDVKNEEITVSNNNSHPKSENRNDINNFEQNLSKNNLLEVGNGNVVESTHSTNTFETASNTDNLEFSSATDISIGNSKNMNKNRNIISYTSSEEQNSGSEKKKALLKRTSRSSSEEKSSTSSSRQTCINKIEKRDISQEQISNTGKNLVKGNIRPKLIVESLAVKNPTKQLRESSDERESVSSGPELNLPKKKKMAKVKTLRLCSMECESASSEPDQNKKKKNIKIKKSRSNFKYLNSLRNRSEPNTGKNNWCNLSNEQKSVEANNYLHVPNEVKHDVNETESPELHNVPGCMLRGSKQEITRDSSEERELANIPFKFNKVYRRGTSIRKKKLLSSSDKERPTSEHSTPNNRREHSLDSSEDRDGFTSSSDNNLMKTVSAKKKSKDGRFLHNNNEQIVKDKSIKSVLNNSEISNIMNRSNDLKNNVISKNTETMLKQSNNNSLGLEHTETVNIKKTVQCIGPIIVDLIEDLAQQIEKSQRICNKTLIDYDNVNVNSKSIMEADVAYDTNQAEGNKEVERKENEVIDNDKKELNPKQESITSTKNYEHYSRKQTLPKMWSYSKSVLDESNSNTEDVLPKHKKPVGNSWKNSDDAERSMEFFNEWRQKLDRTKASCEDMLAKLKLVRDNECIINKSRYYSIDKAINWEKEIGNKPTISDIIKRLSQTQPEREFFMYKRYVDTLPVYTYSHNNDKTKRDACDLGMLIEDNINLMRKHSRRLCSESSDLKPTTDSHIPEKTPSPVIRGILPHIKQRMKQPPTNNLFCSGQRVDDFYAVGMSLKSLKVNQNKKQILLPLGSDHCQAVNSTIPTQAEKGFL
ncbi:hypothetical protein C0J52_01189 [Blattella germanica]|nr:hypothetical protein C0J52_01189 [Blattella germanica]